MTTGPVIELRSATKRFRSATGGVHTAVRELTLSVQPGEFVAVVGPTGCGKSTTLSLVSGLEPPSSGVALVRGEPVLGIPDGIGYMFQNDAVQPWRSVLDNVAAGPRYRGMTKAKAREKARVWVDKVGLGIHYLLSQLLLLDPVEEHIVDRADIILEKPHPGVGRQEKD